MAFAFAPPHWHSSLEASSLTFGSTLSPSTLPPHPGAAPRSAKWQLLVARELAQPGFMSLQAVREHGQVVDFFWDSADAAAARWLGHETSDLCGQRLSVVLAHHPGLPAVLARYRCVVQTGAGAAIKYVQPLGSGSGSGNVIRHGAVRLGDGVAVTVTNLSALRRVKALRIEVALRRALPMTSVE